MAHPLPQREPHVASRGNDHSAQLEVWFLLNEYCFCTIIRSKNRKFNHPRLGTVCILPIPENKKTWCINRSFAKILNIFVKKHLKNGTQEITKLKISKGMLKYLRIFKEYLGVGSPCSKL